MLWCTALFGLMAQQPEFRVDVDVVNLLATVRDASGRVASGLTKDDFILEENGRPQQIRYFASQSELPMTIGLLIDTSFSQRRILESQRSAAREFFGNVLRPEQDRAFVVSFDYEVQTIQGMTALGDVLSAALDRLSTPPSQVEYSRHKTGKRRPTAGTKIYDALVMACDGKLRPVAGRKAVLLISDGVDMGSAKTLADAIRAAQVADAVVYAIRYYDPAAYRPLGGGGEAAPAERGAEKLRRIAAETGGRMLEAAGAAELHRIFRQVEEELRNQYSIGYTPEGGGGGYRAIRLRTRQQGLEVQTRAGYYR